jgi:hypothetical protein
VVVLEERAVRKIFSILRAQDIFDIGVIGALATVAITSNADAFSVSPVPNSRSDVMLIAGGMRRGLVADAGIQSPAIFVGLK